MDGISNQALKKRSVPPWIENYTYEVLCEQRHIYTCTILGTFSANIPPLQPITHFPFHVLLSDCRAHKRLSFSFDSKLDRYVCSDDSDGTLTKMN